MILSGKNLVVYRLNKIAKFVAMAGIISVFTALMMLVCIVFG